MHTCFYLAVQNVVRDCPHALTLLVKDKLHEAVVNLSHSKVESNVRLGPNIHANGDGEEIVAIEKALLQDPAVQAELAKLKLPEGSVVVYDPWIYGK